jgi:hypothetical protein
MDEQTNRQTDRQTDGENTCFAWAGGTEVVERKFIPDSHITSSKFNIRVKILKLCMF